MAKAWPTIYDNVRWSIGDGKLTKFWLDVWLPSGQSLLAYSTQQDIFDINANIADMKGDDGDWDWEGLCGSLTDEGIRELESAVRPVEDDGGDVCYWGGSADGQFRLQDAYSMLAVSGWNAPNPIWRYAWDYTGPERVRYFIWLALRKRLMTNEERHRRHLTASAECPLCYNICESLEHVLRYCVGAKQVWRRLCPTFVQSHYSSCNFEDWFYGNLDCNMVYDGYQWNVLFGLVCWKLWKMRCQWIFEKKCMTTYELIAQCKTWARLVRSNSNTVKLVRAPRLSIWTRPPTGWIKLNCDASMSQGSGMAGGIFRDDSGNYIGGYTRPIRQCSVLHGELQAILDGVVMAYELRYDRLLIETDCKNAVDLVLGSEQVWKCNQMARRINYWRSKMNEVDIKHVYREANSVAEKLVKIGQITRHGLVYLAQPPLDLRPLLQRDKEAPPRSN